MIVGAFSYYLNIDIFIIKTQIRFRSLIKKNFYLNIFFSNLNSYMGYRDDVIEFLLTSPTKEQLEYFNIKPTDLILNEKK